MNCALSLEYTRRLLFHKKFGIQNQKSMLLNQTKKRLGKLLITLECMEIFNQNFKLQRQTKGTKNAQWSCHKSILYAEEKQSHWKNAEKSRRKRLIDWICLWIWGIMQQCDALIPDFPVNLITVQLSCYCHLMLSRALSIRIAIGLGP